MWYPRTIQVSLSFNLFPRLSDVTLDLTHRSDAVLSDDPEHGEKMAVVTFLWCLWFVGGWFIVHAARPYNEAEKAYIREAKESARLRAEAEGELPFRPL